MAIKDILWFYYHRRTSLTETMAAGKLYFNRQVKARYLLLQTPQNFI
jgi:hypothetical protein